MNLINCSADCLYQKDGCCKLENRAPLGAAACSNCSYYVKREPSRAQPPQPPVQR